ncbi:MAG: aminotransferase class IV [Acidobacteriota bacterium]
MDCTELANINGHITPIDRASISVTDHGFLYGDSVYETIRTYDRRPFLMTTHLDRLRRSAAAIRLDLPWSRDHLTRETRRVLARAGGHPTKGEFTIRILVTRGNGPFGYDPGICSTPNLVILLRTLSVPTDEQREHGVQAIIASVRRNPIEALDPRIKSSNLLNNILAALEARDAGADEAILFNTSGFLAEATQSNIFFVRDGQLHTPAIRCGLLSGVTRDLVLELARAARISSHEGMYRREDLLEAGEIFLTSSTREILPISRLDGRSVGSGRCGTVTRRLQQLFHDQVARFLSTTEDGQ